MNYKRTVRLSQALKSNDSASITAEIEAQIVDIATIDAFRADLWNEDPGLAAREAYLAVATAWKEQAAAGLYRKGIPSCEGIECKDTFDIQTGRFEGHTSHDVLNQTLVAGQ